MREIPLTKGYVALVDDEDYEQAAAFKWSADVRFKADGKTIRVVYATHARPHPTKGQVTQFMHRLVAGVTDSKIHVDHRDHNGLNNQKYNLRHATPVDNGGNRKVSINNTSGYKGVSWNSKLGKWKVDIMVKGKSAFLGYFTDVQEAARRYDAFAWLLFGEFAATNEMLREEPAHVA